MTTSKSSSNPSEAGLQASIVQWLKTRGIWVMKAHQTGITQKGIPDLICCVRGRFVGLEVKTETGQTTALQDREHLLIMKSGGICRVVRTLEAVRIIIEEIERGP